MEIKKRSEGTGQGRHRCTSPLGSGLFELAELHCRKMAIFKFVFLCLHHINPI